MLTETRVAIIGGGSFGTALANLSAKIGNKVYQWMRSVEQVKHINTYHINERYFPGLPLHANITASNDAKFVLENADLVFIAVPSKAFREVVVSMRSFLSNKIIISTTKGIEAETFSLMSEILSTEIPNSKIGVLSGPNLAKEIMQGCITASVVATEDTSVCQSVIDALHCEVFSVYSSQDMYGVELGGALKNIYAIVAGLAEALGMGENTKSMLITRALAEMGRFAMTMGANPMTFLGLAGVGDLIVTCTSSLSRNFHIGYKLGKGASLQEAEKSLGQVAEGINTLRLVKEKADHNGVHMPIAEALYEIIFMNKDISEEIKIMMKREQQHDVEFMVR